MPPPPTRHLLPRPRLLQRLAQLLQPPAVAVWIGAATGMGKTTLARQWLGQAAGGHWLRPDAGTGDAAGMLVHLQGLAAPGADSRRAPPLWREQLASPATALRGAWQAAWAALPAGSRLVIDDLHAAGPDAALLAWLPTALDTCPDGLQLLLLSRRAPPPALARLLLSGLLARLPADALAFDAEECQAWRPGAPTGWARWPVALSTAVGDAEREALLVQLVQHELLAEASPAERRTLLQLAWWPGPVDTASALALAGPGADGHLAALADTGRLVDSSAAGWTLHDLLAQALRPLALADSGAATLATLVAAGRPDAAIGVALQACQGATGFDGAADAAARLLVAHAPRWLAACRHRALADACLAVPEARRPPALWAALAAALAPLDPRAGRDAARRALGSDLPADTRRALLVQVIASYFQAFDRTEPLQHWLGLLQALPADCHPQATAVAAFSALFLREPAHPALPGWQRAVQPLPATATDPNLRLRAAMLLAKQAWYTARHATPGLLVVQARSALDDPATSPYGVLLWGLARQYQAWAQADLALGRAASQDALDHASAQGLHGLDRHLRLHDACFARLAGDHDAARAQLQAAQAGADASRRMEAWHLFSVQAWLALEDGHLAEAAEAAALAVQAGADMGPSPQAMAWAIAGQVALVQGRPPTAALAALCGQSSAGLNPRARLMADWLQAAEARLQGRDDAAAQALGRALDGMQQAGAGLWFGLHQAGAAQLVAWGLQRGIRTEAATALVRQHGLQPPPGAGRHWPWPVRLCSGPLGLQVLVDGAPLALAAKQPRRPLDLLALLVELGGEASATTLADQLWPDAEGDRALAAFEVALRRLRGLLGQADVLRLAGGQLSLDRQQVWVEAGSGPAHPPQGRRDGVMPH